MYQNLTKPNHMYLIYISKELVLNNLELLILKPNQTKTEVLVLPRIYDEIFCQLYTVDVLKNWVFRWPSENNPEWIGQVIKTATEMWLLLKEIQGQQKRTEVD